MLVFLRKKEYDKKLIKKMKDCIFCKIARGEIPSVKIWEDKDFFAFLDMSPIKPGHTLVIPKEHSDYAFDMNDENYSALLLASKKVAELLKEK